MQPKKVSTLRGYAIQMKKTTKPPKKISCPGPSQKTKKTRIAEHERSTQRLTCFRPSALWSRTASASPELRSTSMKPRQRSPKDDAVRSPEEKKIANKLLGRLQALSIMLAHLSKSLQTMGGGGGEWGVGGFERGVGRGFDLVGNNRIAPGWLPHHTHKGNTLVPIKKITYWSNSEIVY